MADWDIRSGEDYEAALRRAAALMDAERGTPEGEELARLAAAIEDYEDRRWPMAGGGDSRGGP